jgi:hypothetical protein
MRLVIIGGSDADAGDACCSLPTPAPPLKPDRPSAQRVDPAATAVPKATARPAGVGGQQVYERPAGQCRQMIAQFQEQTCAGAIPAVDHDWFSGRVHAAWATGRPSACHSGNPPSIG